MLGSAITEDPTIGETTLKLDFPLTKMPGRSRMPPAGGESDSVTSDGTSIAGRFTFAPILTKSQVVHLGLAAEFRELDSDLLVLAFSGINDRTRSPPWTTSTPL